MSVLLSGRFRQRPTWRHRQGRFSALQARTRLPSSRVIILNLQGDVSFLTQIEGRAGVSCLASQTHLHPSQTTSIEMLFSSLLLKPVDTLIHFYPCPEEQQAE